MPDVYVRLRSSTGNGANLPMQLGRLLKWRHVDATNQSLNVFEGTDRSPLMVKNLSKKYADGALANQAIDFTGNSREILGILGPNGAGKTTLVRQITTELLPTFGSVTILGHDAVSEPNTVKTFLGVVPQEATLFDYLTVHQHLRIFAKFKGVLPRESSALADQLVRDLELTQYRDVEVKKLSGGLRRRVLIGIASIGRPPLLILDEPTTGLDPQSRRSLWSLLRNKREDGAFVLLTTHSMEEAEALCDRVGIIQDGKMLALDTVYNLRANYGSQFKATFIPDELNSRLANEPVTVYGSNDQELVAQMEKKGITEYFVGKTSLEDVYLNMTGGPNRLDDSDR